MTLLWGNTDTQCQGKPPHGKLVSVVGLSKKSRSLMSIKTTLIICASIVLETLLQTYETKKKQQNTNAKYYYITAIYL